MKTWRPLQKDKQLTDVTPYIKIISFRVRELKNRRVKPNGEEIKDEKRNFLGVFLIVQALTRYQRNSRRREMPYKNEKELFKSYNTGQQQGAWKRKNLFLLCPRGCGLPLFDLFSFLRILKWSWMRKGFRCYPVLRYQHVTDPKHTRRQEDNNFLYIETIKERIKWVNTIPECWIFLVNEPLSTVRPQDKWGHRDKAIAEAQVRSHRHP